MRSPASWSIWEKACDREVLQRELTQGYAATEEALEEEAAMVPPTAIEPGMSAARLH